MVYGITTVRINKNTRDTLNKMRGHNNCITLQDVINYLLQCYQDYKEVTK